MIDDFDFDIDPDMDDFDDDIDDESIQPKTNFGRSFRQQFKLEKLKLKFANKISKRRSSVDKIKAKKQSKLALIMTFAGLLFKMMLDHHVDKLDAEQQKDLVKIAKLEGIPQSNAKKIASMNTKQLAQTISQANDYILKKAATYNA